MNNSGVSRHSFMCAVFLNFNPDTHSLLWLQNAKLLLSLRVKLNEKKTN